MILRSVQGTSGNAEHLSMEYKISSIELNATTAFHPSFRGYLQFILMGQIILIAL